jgi:uncharacterized protein YukE
MEDNKMADRVLSTPDAEAAIREMQRIIDAGLITEIEKLNVQGNRLSEPSVWEGKLAEDFRSQWPGVNAELKKAVTQLQELRQQLQTIYENIMRAGGNM